MLGVIAHTPRTKEDSVPTAISKRTTVTAKATPEGILEAFRKLDGRVPADAQIVEIEDDEISFTGPGSLRFTLSWPA